MNVDQQHFLEACQQGNLQGVEQWTSAGVDPKLSNSLGLRVAARENHTDVVKFLLPHSDPTAYYSEALRAALSYKNKEIIDLLWEVSDIFCDDGEYLGGFYQANMFGVWEKVLPIARTRIEDIDMAKWAFGLLVHSPKTEEIHYIKELRKIILSHIKNEEIIQAVCQTMGKGKMQFQDREFFNLLLDHVEDPQGHILQQATMHGQSLMRHVIQHPHYRTFIPQISHPKLIRTVPVLIKSNDLLGLMQILPYVDTETLGFYILEAFECNVPEIWNLILETKRPCEPTSTTPHSISYQISSQAYKNPSKAVEVFHKFSELNTIPLFYALAGTPEEHLLLPFLSRCTENDVLNWEGALTRRFHGKVLEIQEFFAKLQNQTLHAHISDKNPNAVSKRL